MKHLIILALLILFTLPTTPQEIEPTGYLAEVLREIENSSNRIIQLAEAVPAELYDWRPQEGVRSFREVFMHIADGNYSLPNLIGVSPPDWFAPRYHENNITGKTEAVEALKKSFEHLRSAVQGMTEEDLTRTVRWFGGRENTVRGALLTIVRHIGEHQGQLIAYTRVNGLVPPWSR